MKNWFLIGIAAASSLTPAGWAGEPPPAPHRKTTNILLNLHFAGTRTLAASEDGTQVRKIWDLPESEALRNQTLGKLSRAPGVLYPGRLSEAQIEQGAALLLPLLHDLLQNESVLEIRAGEPAPEWTLAVGLQTDRLADWQTNLTQLLQAWGLGETETLTLESGRWSQLRRAEGLPTVRWGEARGWLLLGVGHGTLPGFQTRLELIHSQGHPAPALDRAWLRADFDLGKLATLLALPASPLWPQVQITVEGRKADLITRMTIVFAEPITGDLEAWRIPTNSIYEPLVSFTGLRGVAPLLERVDLVQRLGMSPVPNQIYAWAQAVAPVQAMWAFPMNNATNWIARTAAAAPQLLGPEWQKRGLTQIEWQATNSTALWKGLPIVVPYLRPARDHGLDYVVGGLFPLLVTTNPPPVDLLKQFTDRPELLGYSWEMTGVRLAQWRLGAQLAAIIVGKPQFTTNTAGLPWLMSVDKHLGNTVTEINAPSPQQWSVVRRSHAGFGGAELVLLTRWLESTQFPRLSLELPETQPRPTNRPAATKPAKAQRSNPGTGR